MARLDRCEECGSRRISIKRETGCMYWFIVLFLCGLPILFYPFLPKMVECKDCGAKYRI